MLGILQITLSADTKGLDLSDPDNFRPSAKVSFFSAVIENIVAFQLSVYLRGNNFAPDF